MNKADQHQIKAEEGTRVLRGVYIYAYKRMNLGDDLFVTILCKRYPDVQFYTVTRKSVSAAFSAIPNLRCIPAFPKTDRLLKRFGVAISLTDGVQSLIARHCDINVHIGGSIFIERAGWETRLRQTTKALRFERPYVVLGSNFGPYNHEEYRVAHEMLFSKMTDVCFRDKHSVALFSARPNIRYAPDVVFAYPLHHKVAKQKRVILSAIDLTNRSALASLDSVYIEKMAALSGAFVLRGYRVTLMSFCEEEGDGRAITRIYHKLQASGQGAAVAVHHYRGDLLEATAAIADSAVVVASRFHAMILGMVYGCSVLPITYSGKFTHVLNDLRYTGLTVDVSTIGRLDIDTAVTTLLAQRPLDVTTQSHAAKAQFAALDRLLSESD